jgi:hypothetical protein
MGHEQHGDTRVDERPHREIRKVLGVPRHRGLKGFVHHQKAPRPKPVHDAAELLQLHVHKPHLAGRVLPAGEMPVNAAEHRACVGRRRDEQTALRHELGLAHAAQEGRFSALVDARNQHQPLPEKRTSLPVGTACSSRARRRFAGFRFQRHPFRA